MPSSVENEIIGDWNNLKGTEYHLIYALWLLVYRKVHSLTFYSGNDLLAHPTAPPILQDTQSIVSLHVEQPEEDKWIQLKATEETWTISALLRDNLLANFLYNALSSERRERAWRVQLITQAAIQKKEVEDFLDDSAGKPRLSKRLNTIVRVVQQRWQSEGQGDVDTAHLREIAFTILSQIAEMRPARLETLKAQIETQLAYACPDPEAVRLIADVLLGAILRDAAPGPEEAPVYTADWVEQVAQRPLMSHTLLTSDPVRACAEVVKAALPSTWDVSSFVSRSSLENAWRQFLAASETLFVLIGGSGVGKSWAVADWVMHVLDGHVRLLIRGSELYNYRELSTLIAAKLRRYAPADWSDEQCLRRLQAASIVKDQGPLVLCIDDLHFPLGTEELSLFVRSLGRLVEQCRERGVKLVLTCQKHIWEALSHSLKKEIAPNNLFSLEPDVRPTPELERAQPQVLYSFLLSDLTPDELTDVLKQRLPAGNAERSALQLRASAFASLRNPYLLNLFLHQYGAHLSEPDEAPTPVSVDALLDKRVQDALLDVAGNLGYDVNDVEHAFHALQRLLWAVRPGGLTSIQSVGCLNTHLFELGNTAMRELRRAGLLTTESPVRLAEPAIAARLFARDLKERLQGGEGVSGELHPEIDADVVGALLRAVSDPVVLAEKLLERDPRWLAAVANGLAQVTQGTPEDYKVLAFLSALAGSQPRGDAGSAIYDALGQLASRGKRAWQWVTGMYLSDRIRERFQGGWALATSTELVPERVEIVMQQRLELGAKINDSKREKRERFLQDALSPLFKMNNRTAAEVGQRILHQYGHLAGAGESRLSRDFLRDTDEIRGRIALWTSSGELDRLLTELSDRNPKIRYRAACALRPIAVERPEGIREALCGAIRREEDARVMNRLLWTAYRLEEVAPAELLEAVEACFIVQWQERYTTTGMALAVLGDIANRNPARVSRLLPRSLDVYESWTRAFLSEMHVYAWWRCAEYMRDARSHLSALTEANLTEISAGYRIFALRGGGDCAVGNDVPRSWSIVR